MTQVHIKKGCINPRLERSESLLARLHKSIPARLKEELKEYMAKVTAALADLTRTVT